MKPEIRTGKSAPTDRSEIRRLYTKAFPEENLLTLVNDLLDNQDTVISLIALNHKKIIGHAAFTLCGFNRSEQNMALLGPVAVNPEYQKQGIGSILIREGLKELEDRSVEKIDVLGDPNYYSRFGFMPEKKIMPPYPLPPEWEPAWQSINLSRQKTETDDTGILTIPEMWQKPSLW